MSNIKIEVSNLLKVYIQLWSITSTSFIKFKLHPAKLWYCPKLKNLTFLCELVILKERRRYRYTVFSRLAGWSLILMKLVEVIDHSWMYTSKTFDASILIFDAVALSQTSKLHIFMRTCYIKSAAAVPLCGIQPFSRMKFDFYETWESDRSQLDVYLQKIWCFYFMHARITAC